MAKMIVRSCSDGCNDNYTYDGTMMRGTELMLVKYWLGLVFMRAILLHIVYNVSGLSGFDRRW